MPSWGRTGRCARALCEKEGILDPFSMMAKVTAVTTAFPDTGLLRFLLSPKTQIKIKRYTSHEKPPRWWVVTGNRALCPRCACAVQKRPRVAE